MNLDLPFEGGNSDSRKCSRREQTVGQAATRCWETEGVVSLSHILTYTLWLVSSHALIVLLYILYIDVKHSNDHSKPFFYVCCCSHLLFNKGGYMYLYKVFCIGGGGMEAQCFLCHFCHYWKVQCEKDTKYKNKGAGGWHIVKVELVIKLRALGNPPKQLKVERLLKFPLWKPAISHIFISNRHTLRCNTEILHKCFVYMCLTSKNTIHLLLLKRQKEGKEGYTGKPLET